MAHETTWLHANRIMLVRLFSTATANDVREVSAQVQTMIHEGAAPVHVIVNLLDMDHMKMGLNDVRQIMLNTDKSTNALMGWTLIVRHNSMTQFFASMAVQMFKVNFAFVDSMDDALVFLRERDLSLQDVTFAANTAEE